jgi:hypothetical protein
MIYVVLGLGFSGTTLVSELLHHAGVTMISAVADSYESGGKYEHPDFKDVNKQLLDLRGARVTHLRPGQCPRRAPPGCRARMEHIVSLQHSRCADWGFKDPRTVLTYPLWRAVLPPHRIIGIYRDPAEIWPRRRAKHHGCRWLDGWYALRHLRQWCEYNDAIIRYCARFDGQCLILNYRRLMSTDEELARISRFIGRKVPDRRRPARHRSDPCRDPVFETIRNAMDRFGPWRPRVVARRLALLGMTGAPLER